MEILLTLLKRGRQLVQILLVHKMFPLLHSGLKMHEFLIYQNMKDHDFFAGGLHQQRRIEIIKGLLRN